MYLDKNGLPINHPNTVFKGYQRLTSEYEDRDPRMDIFFLKPGDASGYSHNPCTMQTGTIWMIQTEELSIMWNSVSGLRQDTGM